MTTLEQHSKIVHEAYKRGFKACLLLVVALGVVLWAIYAYNATQRLTAGVYPPLARNDMQALGLYDKLSIK